jgi:hypothetical protein
VLKAQKGVVKMKQLNWYDFLVNLLKGSMQNENSEYYWKNLTTDNVERILSTKSDMFKECFTTAFNELILEI